MAETDREEFARLTGPFRRELLAHCYRMLGSVEEAEDLVQETYLRAWRAHNDFEGRASLRTWLYRIATNACITALEGRSRRPLPSGLGAPGDDPEEPLAPALTDVPWLQPMPDALLLTGAGTDPAAIAAARQSTRLALVAALQYLHPRQRAVLILREVLAWPAAEVAGMLGTTRAAVNSLLQRARAQLQHVAPAEEEIAEPEDSRVRELVDRYVAAFERADVSGLMKLLTDDAVLEMPPYAAWFRGREMIGRFLAPRGFAVPGTYQVVRTASNGQPAIAAYRRDSAGVHRAWSVHVLTVGAGGIARINAFLDPGLFAAFGLPQVHGSPAAADSPQAALPSSRR
jgi:RNA polymerase sigma-70 factor, ECF subfamily